MSEKISTVFNNSPGDGDDPSKDFSTAVDFDEGTKEAYSRKQTANAIAFSLGIPDSDGNSANPIINSFAVSIDPDTLVADLVWSVSSGAAITGWIIKEDDTDLPDSGDSDWQTAEPDTFTLSNYNLHNLTARVRVSTTLVSNPVTTEIQGSLSTLPTIATFSVINPDSESKTFTFDMTVTGSPTHRMFVYNDNTPPALGDAGWIADTFPITGETADLDELIDSTVYAYVKTSTLVSPAVTAFVDVTIGGDTAANGDWLHANTPTIPVFNSNNPIVYSGSGTLTIDGTSAGLADAESGTDGLVHFLQVNGTYTTVNIHNMDLTGSRLSLIHMDGLSGATITVRNCKFGTSNRDGETENQQKKAIIFNDCKNCTIKVYGNWFDLPDGCMQTEDCDGSVIDIQYNFCNGMQSNGSNTNDFWKNLTNFYTGRNGNVTGQIKNNIYYAPNNPHSTSQLEDVFNLHVTSGTSGDEIEINRNRVWGGGGGDTGTCFQIGDKNYNGYVWVDENTAIDTNGLFHLSLGHHHKFINNKGYQSELNPSVGPGFSGQIQRRYLTGGKLHDCTVENNTVLWFHDPEDGSPLQERLIYYPSYGRDTDGSQGYPNHGTCTTCDVNNQGNISPTGLSNNEWSYQAWTNGQGKSELWRESWRTFSYAGADGLTPIISHDSPWSGDGGSQNFSASSITSSLFGDGANADDVQTHDVLSLAVGGVSPYTIVSATAVTNCSVSNNINSVIWTAGSTDGGAFTYQYILQDDTGAQATGTISGTLASVSATDNHFDQDGEVYISITLDPATLTAGDNWEYYPRNGYAWEDRTGGSSPDNTYKQCTPYSGSVAIGDVETQSAEGRLRCHFDANGTYTVSILAKATDGNYNELYVGFDDTPNVNWIRIFPVDGTYSWDDGTRDGSAVQITISAAPENHTFHFWTREGGFALGKIHITSGAAPTGSGETESPLNPY